MAQIKGTDVAVGYEKRTVAGNINFEVNEGDYLYVIGENGSGKSTLMKCILGLEKTVSGSIVFGDNLKQKEIGYLPQQNFIQRDFPSTVGEIVLSGCLNRLGWRPFFEILDLEKRSYPELSGGQQQRVLLARALCATGKLLLLDEPAAGLDPIVQEQLYTLIYKINKEDKITIVMVSHDIEAAKKYATHILHIGKEKSVFCTKREFLKENGGCLY